MTAPTLKIGHFQVSFSWPLSSARAIDPRADMGAVGKGSCSRSEVRRKRTYPEVNHETRPTMVPRTRRPMGQAQSGWRKVRSPWASDSGPGAHQNGRTSETPNCSASGERTKYCRHSRSRKAPSSRTTSAPAT